MSSASSVAPPRIMHRSYLVFDQQALGLAVAVMRPRVPGTVFLDGRPATVPQPRRAKRPSNLGTKPVIPSLSGSRCSTRGEARARPTPPSASRHQIRSRHSLHGRLDEASCPCVNAEPAATEGRDMQQAAGDHQIFQKVNHLILIGEVRVERGGRRQGEDGHG